MTYRTRTTVSMLTVNAGKLLKSYLFTKKKKIYGPIINFTKIINIFVSTTTQSI